MSAALARPHKILDSWELECWMNENYPELELEWELGDEVEWLDLWDWLEREYGDILTEFETQWREKSAGQKS